MERHGGGQIVVLSSSQGFRPIPLLAAYSAAKVGRRRRPFHDCSRRFALLVAHLVSLRVYRPRILDDPRPMPHASAHRHENDLL